MASRSVQLVLHYDGAGFSGWQRQPGERTVQGVLEAAAAKLCGESITVVGAGRTDAGVHARGQAAGLRVPGKWSASALRRSMNAILPDDVWIAAAFEMRDEFHPRYSATSRSYSYLVGTDDFASSPFRRKHELVWRKPLSLDRLSSAAERVAFTHPTSDSNEETAYTRERLEEISREFAFPVCVPVGAVTSADIYSEARELAKVSDHVVVQIPLVEDSLVPMSRLTAEGVVICATFVYSPAQAIVAAKAGAASVRVALTDLETYGQAATRTLA